MSEVYILWEGFHDRAFWKGLLLNLQCTDPGLKSDGSRKPIFDPWSLEVKGGTYCFRGPTNKFIRVVPTGSRSNILRLAKMRLESRQQKELSLIINCDSDEHADGSVTNRELQISTILSMVSEFDPDATQNDGLTISMDAGATIVHSFPWRADDPPARGLPNQQVLERLISAAIVAAFANRADSVENWLASRPEPPSANAKEHALSYFAGWYAERGSYEAFCEAIWQDQEIAQQLRHRLMHQGVWNHLQSAAG